MTADALAYRTRLRLIGSDAPTGLRAQQKRFTRICCALLLTIALYFPTSLSLLRMWNAFGSRFYTQGDLIAALAVLALTRRRTVLQHTSQVPNLTAALLLLPLSLLWLLADLSNFKVAHQACFPVILWMVVRAFFGAETARICRFPIGYLYFAIPLWEWIRGPLQALTVDAVGIALPLAGIPALIAGNIVEIPAGSFAIRGGCAGEAYLLVAVAIAVYYGDMTRSSLRMRVFLAAIAAALSILGNWLRVFAIVVIGQLTGMQHYLVRVSHDGFGWAVFAFAMAIFVVSARHATQVSPSTLRQTLVADVAAAQRTREPGSEVSKPMLVAITAAACLAMGPTWSAINWHRSLRGPPREFLPPGLNGWAGPASYGGTWHPVFASADVQRQGVYNSTDGQLVVYIAEYLSQSDHAKLHAAGNSVLGHVDPGVEGEGLVTEQGHSLRELQGRDPAGEQWLMWVAYEIGGRVFPSLPSAQLWYALESLSGSPSSHVVALRAPCVPNCSDARALLSRFVGDNAWVLTQELRASSGSGLLDHNRSARREPSLSTR
jgi:exosortase